MERFGWALVGTSGYADKVFAPAIKAAPQARLLGAAGSTPERSEAFRRRHDATRAYASLSELANDPEVQAVWIATPNDLHAPVALGLIRAGKHVLVEKPLATRVADAEAVVAAAEQRGVVLRVGYHHRFRRAHQLIRNMVAEGRVGRPGFFRIHMFARYPAPPPEWRQKAETSGGWAINDVGTHLIDLMLWITGLPAGVAGARLATQRFEVPTDDAAAVLFRLGDTAIGIMETSTGLGSPASRIEVYGDGGWIRAEGTLTGSGVVEASDGTRSSFAEEDAFAAEVTDFCEAIAGRPSIGAGGPIAVINVRLIQEARRVHPAIEGTP